MDIQNFISKKIREAREEKGITQKELADALGYSPMGISHFERGMRGIKMSDIEKLAKYLGKKMFYFLPPEEKEEKIETTFLRNDDSNDSKKQA